MLAEVAKIRAAGEKVVVFSDAKDPLEVLHEALRRSRGDGATAAIYGNCNTSHNDRMVALNRFRTSALCHVLLLSVGACASGLTLTHANHCILLELQVRTSTHRIPRPIPPDPSRSLPIPLRTT